jgi:hypothetical protein
MPINPEINLLTGPELHRQVIREAVLNADNYVWIATANLKDMHIPRGRRYKPILEAFNDMAGQGVSFRIIHSDLPSRPFRKTLDRFPRLIAGALELQICRRSHWKMVIVDGRFAYLGSANFTGPGPGPRVGKNPISNWGSHHTIPFWCRGLWISTTRFGWAHTVWIAPGVKTVQIPSKRTEKRECAGSHAYVLGRFLGACPRVCPELVEGADLYGGHC